MSERKTVDREERMPWVRAPWSREPVSGEEYSSQHPYLFQYQLDVMQQELQRVPKNLTRDPLPTNRECGLLPSSGYPALVDVDGVSRKLCLGAGLHLPLPLLLDPLWDA